MRRPPILVSATFVSLILSSCGNDSTSDDSAVATNELGPVHVHGLGVDPADESLYIATHTGMFRIADGAERAARVGDSFQDTMGFTVAGPGRFLGSGHPDLRTDLPPYLGLIESTDGAKSWEPVSLLGTADFHVLESVEDRVYGFGFDFDTRREQMLVSRDGGKSWNRLDPPESVLSLAINPEDPDELLMSGRRRLYRSADAGASWAAVAGEPGLVSWPAGSDPYLVRGDGTVARADGLGDEWQPVGTIGSEPAAFEAVEARLLYAARHDGTIEQSTDGGRTWDVRSTP